MKMRMLKGGAIPVGMALASDMHLVRPVGPSTREQMDGGQPSAKWVRTIRTELGMSQRQLANWLGVDPSYVSKLEADDTLVVGMTRREQGVETGEDGDGSPPIL